MSQSLKNLIHSFGHIQSAVRASTEYKRLSRLPANSAARSDKLAGFLAN
ncbi:hypothetical protein [Pararhizobium sp.]|nr:hypothetical protein [Pararhizobium sp.]MDO9418004.1 hypothetical protein [Pararhizobium sp.]